MATAKTLTEYLQAHEVEFDTRPHDLTSTSSESAEAAHVPGNQVAKGVVYNDGDEYVMAVVPSTARIDEHELAELLHREIELVAEKQFPEIFPDCRIGAVPPVGMAYGIPTVVDESLMRENEIYFEGGDHELLVHVSGDGFRRLMAGTKGGTFCRSAEQS